MTTYLVGLDPSEHSRAALSWACDVATADDTIVALHAWELPVGNGLRARARSSTPPTADRGPPTFVRELVAEHDDPRIEARVADGSPGRALVDAAEALGPDLVVVVGHGGTGKASLLLGSTAHHVVHHADLPVVVVRGEVRAAGAAGRRRASTGFDDDEVPDERSMAALRWALRLPGASRVAVSHADFVPAVAAGPVREPGLESDEERAEDDSALRHAIDQATDGTGVAPNGAEIVPVVAAGTGAFALIEASRDADLIVIGTRGRSGLRRAHRRLDDARGPGPRPLPGRRRPLAPRPSGPSAHPLRRMGRDMPDAPLAGLEPAPRPPTTDPPTDGLNPDQLDAVVHRGGPLLVVAGAGSGKTRVLTHRIAHLVHDGVHPSRILAITFTNKAAGEMRQRVAALVGPVARTMWVSTFHSACVRILRANADRLGYPRQFSIYDQADAVRLTGYVIRDLHLDAKRFTPRGVHGLVSLWKNELLGPDDVTARAQNIFDRKHADVYREYQDRLHKAGAMDFDDLLVNTVRLLRDHPDVLAALPGALRAHPRRRVPGHQPGPERDRPAARRRPPQRHRRRRHRPVPAGRDARSHGEGRRADRVDGGRRRRDRRRRSTAWRPAWSPTSTAVATTSRSLRVT